MVGMSCINGRGLLDLMLRLCRCAWLFVTVALLVPHTTTALTPKLRVHDYKSSPSFIARYSHSIDALAVVPPLLGGYKTCKTNEKSSLLLLHSQTKGPTWKNKWDVSTDPCRDEWYGIRCNEDGNVIRIHLYSNQLLGALPKFFGRFPNLEYLHLGSNRLTGKLPDSMADLTALRFLNLADNALIGDVPGYFADLPRLKNLDLSHNNFTPNTLSKESQDLSATKGTKIEYTKFDNSFTNQAGSNVVLKELL